MKKKLLTLSLIFMIMGCTKSTKWEYKEFKINNTNSSSSYGKMGTSNFESEIDQLNSFGEDGWELVSTHTIIETEFPNFGNEGYHTGIKPNSRTKSIVYVFKKPKEENKK